MLLLVFCSLHFSFGFDYIPLELFSLFTLVEPFFLSHIMHLLTMWYNLLNCLLPANIHCILHHCNINNKSLVCIFFSFLTCLFLLLLFFQLVIIIAILIFILAYHLCYNNISYYFFFFSVLLKCFKTEHRDH